MNIDIRTADWEDIDKVRAKGDGPVWTMLKRDSKGEWLILQESLTEMMKREKQEEGFGALKSGPTIPVPMIQYKISAGTAPTRFAAQVTSVITAYATKRRFSRMVIFISEPRACGDSELESYVGVALKSGV